MKHLKKFEKYVELDKLIDLSKYMMYHKALTFNDVDTAEEILDELNPKSQKRLGRQVKNFDPKVWDKVKFNIVKKGLREKFTQNSDLKNIY
jgi:ribA/ribD-fused uncharacterized protein